MIYTSTLWHWGSPVWLLAAAVLFAYVLAFRATGLRRLWVLALGLTFWVLAFVSPIGTLADGYLFSAHMVQHLLMLLVIPLCLLLSLPPQTEAWQLHRSGLDQLVSWNGLPLVGWMLGVGAMWFWHVPSLCNASTQSDAIGLIRDSSFIIAGLLFWWPIYSPIESCRIRPLDGICYLFAACLGCTLLGIYLTFTTVSVCPAFANPADRLAIVSRLYQAGFTPDVDQSLGGLLMWVPPCLLYVGANISLLVRWYCCLDDRPQVRPQVASEKQPSYVP